MSKYKSLRGNFAASTLASCLLFATTAALADDGNVSDSTVVVVGKRRGDNPHADPKAPYRAVESASTLFTEPLLDTPKSVNVLTKELLDDMGVSTMRDLFRTQPGITLATGEGGNAFGDRVFIRGFDARNDVYIDGVRDPGLGSREMFATQQVEILRGPSSAFGGRGTTGGSISMVSKQPRSRDETSVELTLGSDGLARLTIDANRELTENLALRVNLMAHENDTPGRDNVFNKRWGAAAAIDYHPIENLRLAVDYYHLDTDYMPDWGLPWNLLTQGVGDVGRTTFYGIRNRDFGDTLNDVSTLSADWEIKDNLTLHSVIRYGQVNNRYRATAPEGANFTSATVGGTPALSLSANAKNRFQLTEYVTNQTNLTWKIGSGAITNTLVGGYEISQEETRMRGFSFTECGAGACVGTAPRIYQNLFNPDFNYPWQVTAETLSSLTTIETETQAAYLIDTVHFGEKWIGMAGIRFDNYQTERNAFNYTSNTASVPIASDSDFLTYHLGLVYKPVESVSIYTSYSTSANPPCEQLDSTTADYGGCDTTTFAIEPIENEAFELGTKILINDHMELTAAYFILNRTGVPSVVRVGTTNVLYSENQEASGVEIMVSGNPTKRLSLAGGFTMLATNTSESTNPVSQNLNKSFPNVSELTFTLTGKYEMTENLSLGGMFVSQSEKFGGTYSAGNNRLPGFNRLDVFGDFELRENLKLRFNILNVSDEFYFDTLYRSNTPYVYVAPGRSYSLTLDWHF